MENFVLLYHFEDQKLEKSFEKEIHDNFPRHRIEENGDFRYFGFAERAEPAVIDKLNSVLTKQGTSMKDYIALYSSGKENSDKISRQMLLGHDNVLETKVEKLSFDAHRGNLTRLLDYDYVKHIPNPEKKD
jgi:hypothetical protein